MSADVFDCHDSGVRYRHLAGRGQRSWQTSYSTQGRPWQAKTDQPQMLIRAKAENPSAEPGLASFTVEEASGDLASNADSDQVSGECLCLFSCSVVSTLLRPHEL